MVRDFIMDEAYFNEYIQEEERRIQKFKSKLDLKEVKEDRIYPVKRKIDSIQFGIFVAKYSAGYPISDLAKDFEDLIKNMPMFWNKDSSYIDMLWMMSIAVMLEVNKETFLILVDLVDKYDRHDELLDFLISYKFNRQVDVTNHNFQMKEPYKRLEDIILNNKVSADELKIYLEKYWYDGHKDIGWYDIHKVKEKLYYGYWSFEAGAIAKILKIDDSSLKDVQYYPYDLVHYVN